MMMARQHDLKEEKMITEQWMMTAVWQEGLT